MPHNLRTHIPSELICCWVWWRMVSTMMLNREHDFISLMFSIM
jgi:hypothetical protein